MDIILTHNHMDFDALSSLVAASKLHEEAAMVLPKQQNDQVQQFLAIYRDSFPFLTENEVNWEDVHHVILTDVNTLRRTVAHQKNVSPTTITVYDHHPLSRPHLPQRDVHHDRLLRGALVDQPPTLRDRGHICGARLGDRLCGRPAARPTQLQSIG